MRHYRNVTRGNGVIVGSLVAVWIVGFARTDAENAAGLVGNTVYRTAGVLVAGVLLSSLASAAPKVAKGLAAIMAFTIVAGKAEAINDTTRRVTGGRAKG